MQPHLLNCAIFPSALAATRRRLIESSAEPISLEAGFGVGDITHPSKTSLRFQFLIPSARKAEEIAWHPIRLLPAHLVRKSRVEC
jgi:hypothetical protein